MVSLPNNRKGIATVATIQNKGGDKWILCASDGTGANGKRIRYTKIFVGSERQALKAATLFEEEMKTSQFDAANKRITFARYSVLWLKDYATPNLAPKTLDRYKKMLNDRILPLIGHVRLDKLGPLAITRMVNNLKDAPRADGKKGALSQKTIQHYYRLVSTMLKTATDWGIIKANPCSKVKTPHAPRPRVKVYNESEAAALLTALETAPLKYRVLIWLEIASGLREGEIMGLEWGDVNLDTGTVSVVRTSQYLSTIGTYTKEPKTEESVRSLSIPANVVDLLKQYKSLQNEARLKLGSLWKGSDRLFTTWDGQPGHPYWPGNWLTRFLKDNNLPHCSFHSLRHLNATLAIKAGVPLKNISSRLGHKDITTTANIYAEALKSVDIEAAEKLGAMLDNKFGVKNGN